MLNHKTWQVFAAERPDLAEIGEGLFYQDLEYALGYLATVAPDGGPRVHPVFPVLAIGQLWLFIVNISPKYRDLLWNGQFALHALPTAVGGQEFQIRGRAAEVIDQDVRRQVVDATEDRQGTADFESLFLCELRSVLFTKWEDWGTDSAWPSHFKWQA